jgi:hypothetical protein
MNIMIALLVYLALALPSAIFVGKWFKAGSGE